MAKDEAIFDSITPKGPDIGADRDAAQCNLVCVCIDDRKQCNSVAGGGNYMNPEVITVSSASTHRDVVDQANLRDASDFASFDPGPGLKDILRADKISHLIDDIPKLQLEDPILGVVGKWMKAGSPPKQAGMG